MESLFLKILIKNDDRTIEELRNEGLLFSSISEVLNIDREQIIEIDETNYGKEVINLKKKYN